MDIKRKRKTSTSKKNQIKKENYIDITLHILGNINDDFVRTIFLDCENLDYKKFVNPFDIGRYVTEKIREILIRSNKWKDGAKI